MTDPTDMPQAAELEIRERLTLLERWSESADALLEILSLVALLAVVATVTLTLKRRLRS